MAEVLAVTASAISLAGFAGQLAQGSSFLYDFFKDFQDAPEDIQALSRELQIFVLILTSIRQSPSQDVILGQALKDCEQVIVKLSAIVNKIQPTQNVPKPKRWAKQFRATLKLSEVSKHLRALERAKSTLLQCRMSAVRADQAREQNSIEAIETSLSDFLRDQASYSTVANDIISLMRQVNSETLTLGATTTNIALVTTKTHSMTERLLNEMLRMREVSARIETATQGLVESAFANQAALTRLSSQSIERTTNSSASLHRKEILDIKTNARRQANIPLNHNRDENVTIPTYTMPHCHSTIDQSSISREGWVRSSTESTMTYLTRNSLFGTLIMTTTAVSYRRRHDQKPDEVDEKKASYTTIKYLPGSWTPSRGFIGTYSTRTGPNPFTSSPSFSLRTVNVVPYHSDIIRACMNLDLNAVRRLLQDGRASPYDVDDSGRNLIRYVLEGAYLTTFGSGYKFIKIADKLIPLLDMLTSLGVDAEIPILLLSYELGNYPGSPNKSKDALDYTMSMILTRAQNDPFRAKEADISVDEHGEYYGYLGTSHPYCNIHPVVLEFLLRQEEWPLTWILRHVCNFHIAYYSIANYVKFWVTCPAEQVDVVFQAKLRLFQLIVKCSKVIPAQLTRAIYDVIHYGGEVISLLTEHRYSDGTIPWIRDRVKKLTSLRAWMLDTLQLLLPSWLPHLPSTDSILEASRYAQSYNIRTAHIWHTALSSAGVEGEHGIATQLEVQGMESVHGGSCDGEWETDHPGEADSEWETEEEWEEDPMQESAKGINGGVERTTRDKRPSGNTCRGAEEGYDEDYWTRAYDGVSWHRSDDDTPLKSKGVLQTLARATCSVVSYVV
ncbi:hypothetical protein GGR53DRAFT_481330 [Hypoxylon sp. FL1150]|nr:hypothetical protein GGR53DRAFT_481330 [Hypoxylon sp. FL1150]